MRVVLLWSGGVDSTAALYHYLLGGHTVYGLFINYGQLNAEKELDAVRSIMSSVRKDLPTKVHKRFQGLTTRVVPLTENPMTGGEELNHTKSYSTFEVPGRNSIFATVAYYQARLLGAHAVGLGVCKGLPVVDHKVTDASYAWAEKLVGLFGVMNTSVKKSLKVVLDTPFVSQTKADVVEWARDNNVPLYETWSCFFPSEEGVICGECPPCLERAQLQVD